MNELTISDAKIEILLSVMSVQDLKSAFSYFGSAAFHLDEVRYEAHQSKRDNEYTHFIVKTEKFAVSVKPSNLLISWKQLILPAGSAGVVYALSGAGAYSVLAALAKGIVYVFDEIDHGILSVIYKNSDFLPLHTEDFFDRFHDMLPPRVNRILFFERLIKLAEVGAISIDSDLIRTNETVFSVRI
jgi:hypothetical protein